jgi:cytochrome c-type biogenesis protein CcmE
MTPRQRRLTLVLGIVAGVSIAGAFALTAMRENVTFFLNPSEVSQGKIAEGEHFRLGGMVEKGSIRREAGSMEVRFIVTDFANDVPVSYTGVLPDLFREGQGVVANGRLTNGTFVAEEVLAKHDEKYMPPAIAKALKDKQPPAEGATASSPQPEAGT